MILQQGHIEFKSGAKVTTKARRKKVTHSQRRTHQKTRRTVWTMEITERIESLNQYTAQCYERNAKSEAQKADRKAKRKRNK